MTIWTDILKEAQAGEDALSAGGDYIFPEGTFRGKMVEPVTASGESYRVNYLTKDDVEANPNLAWMLKARDGGEPFFTGDQTKVTVRFQVLDTLEVPEGGREAKQTEAINQDFVIKANGVSIQNITSEPNGEGSAMHGKNARMYGYLANALGCIDADGPVAEFPELLLEGTFEDNAEVVFKVKHRKKQNGKMVAEVSNIQPV
jgi:hypothetical protein